MATLLDLLDRTWLPSWGPCPAEHLHCNHYLVTDCHDAAAGAAGSVAAGAAGGGRGAADAGAAGVAAAVQSEAHQRLAQSSHQSPCQQR